MLGLILKLLDSSTETKVNGDLNLLKSIPFFDTSTKSWSPGWKQFFVGGRKNAWSLDDEWSNTCDTDRHVEFKSEMNLTVFLSPMLLKWSPWIWILVCPVYKTCRGTISVISGASSYANKVILYSRTNPTRLQGVRANRMIAFSQDLVQWFWSCVNDIIEFLQHLVKLLQNDWLCTEYLYNCYHGLVKFAESGEKLLRPSSWGSMHMDIYGRTGVITLWKASP